jgi:hypothetical protein
MDYGDSNYNSRMDNDNSHMDSSMDTARIYTQLLLHTN